MVQRGSKMQDAYSVKKYPNWLFFWRTNTSTLAKIAYNLFRGKRGRIWSQIFDFWLNRDLKSRSKFPCNIKNGFGNFSFFRWVKLIWCKKSVSKQLQYIYRLMFVKTRFENFYFEPLLAVYQKWNIRKIRWFS